MDCSSTATLGGKEHHDSRWAKLQRLSVMCSLLVKYPHRAQCSADEGFVVMAAPEPFGTAHVGAGDRYR